MVDHLKETTRVPQDGPTKVDPASPTAEPGEFKIVELRDGVAIVEMEDGRMFPAGIAEGLELKRRDKVTLKIEETNKDGVPVGATITKVK